MCRSCPIHLLPDTPSHQKAGLRGPVLLGPRIHSLIMPHWGPGCGATYPGRRTGPVTVARSSLNSQHAVPGPQQKSPVLGNNGQTRGGQVRSFRILPRALAWTWKSVTGRTAPGPRLLELGVGGARRSELAGCRLGSEPIPGGAKGQGRDGVPWRGLGGGPSGTFFQSPATSSTLRASPGRRSGAGGRDGQGG